MSGVKTVLNEKKWTALNYREGQKTCCERNNQKRPILKIIPFFKTMVYDDPMYIFLFGRSVVNALNYSRNQVGYTNKESSQNSIKFDW